jgi:tRNA A-37 threonylcarbamoyl transferase component Bud32
LQISATQVVKIGRFVNLHEAESLRLIAERAPSVPVPEVYNAYRINGLSYIVMEYIPGEDLGCWDTFCAEEKQSVLCQLQKHVAAWRSITASFFGSVVEGPCEDSIFAHSYGKEIKYGPFKSRQQFNEGVVQALRDSRPNPSQYNVSLEKGVLKRQGEEAIFTHGDLGRQNIIYKDGIVTIVDWGSAGFSIREREYVETRWQASMSEDWEQHISTIFPDSNEEDYDFWNGLVNDMRQFSGI